MKWQGIISLVCTGLLAGCVTVGAENYGNEENPERAAEYNTRLGVGYMQQGRRDLALAKLEKALEQEDDYAPAHSAIAVLYESMDEITLAREHYREALDIEPDNPNAQNNYGAFLCRHGEYREAEKYFLSAARNPRYATPEWAWTNAGICVEKIPDLASAELYYRQALDRNPRFADALLQMAELSYQQKKYLSARGFLQRYSEFGQASADSLYAGFLIETAMHDNAAAARYAAKLRRDFPTAPQTQKLRDGVR